MVNSQKIISLIKDGYNFSQVARELSCSRNTVKSHFWKHTNSHHIAIPNLWGLTEKEIVEIVTRKQDGDTAQEIADDFEISKSYVYKLVKKWGENASR